MLKIKTLFILMLLLAGFTVSACADEIHISAAASLTDVVKELVDNYQNINTAVELRPNFTSSGALAKQIYAGAPADIFISANPKWVEYLQQHELIAADSIKVLVQNRMVLVGMPTAAVTTLEQLTRFQRVAICSPKSSPAGKYAEQALIAVGVYPQLVAEQKLVLSKDVRQALLYADRGEVDGAFVYRTDALLANQAQILLEVPQQFYPQVVYPAALTLTGTQKSVARDFYAYLFSVEAQHVFLKYGFLLPN